MKVTEKIKLVKIINGKSYPIFIDLKGEKISVNVSQHDGSNEQLTEILQDLANEFEGKFVVEKHVDKHHHHNHTHTHDKNLEKH